MKDNYVLGVGIIGIISGIAGIAGAISSRQSGKKIEELEGQLSKKVNNIANNLDVDIPDEIVERAVRIAAEAEARRAVKDVGGKIIKEYEGEVRSQVRNSVDLAYANTKSDVKAELSRQVSNLDISGIKKEIIEEASEKAKEKLDEELESIATKFSNDLESSSKILKVVSDKLGTNN